MTEMWNYYNTENYYRYTLFVCSLQDKEGRSVDLSAGITVTSVHEGGEGDGFSLDFALSGHSFGPK